MAQYYFFKIIIGLHLTYIVSRLCNCREYVLSIDLIILTLLLHNFLKRISFK